MKKLNSVVFIEKAKEIHGNKYDYSLVEYKNSSTKVKIICQKHGIFEQMPNNHTSQKQGCGKCDGKHKTTSDFIEDAKKVHNNRYDYRLVEYKNSKDKIKIICKEHGIFEQTPNSHLRGDNCFKCSDTVSTTEEFIKKVKKVHGNKYDYSKINYINNKTNVKIICPEHGVFEQRPFMHLKGCGCPKCAGKNKTTEEFIKEIILAHGNKYDYTLVEYSGVFNKIKIICPKHGVFEQVATTHLKGKGCPICKESKGEKEIRKYLLENNIKFTSQKTFEGCMDRKLLPFDFYLPDYNICIEFDGRQHFEVIDRWGGLNGFVDQQKKDKIKNKYCNNNKIYLIRFDYKNDLRLELPKKLSTFMNKNK